MIPLPVCKELSSKPVTSDSVYSVEYNNITRSMNIEIDDEVIRYSDRNIPQVIKEWYIPVDGVTYYDVYKSYLRVIAWLKE